MNQHEDDRSAESTVFNLKCNGAEYQGNIFAVSLCKICIYSGDSRY